MDVYGVSSDTTTTTNNVDYFPIDDLLDFSNEDLFSSSSTASTSSSSSSTDHSLLLLPPPPPPQQISVSNFHHNYHAYPNSLGLDFNPHLSLPNDDVAELEWLSRFVDDSFTDIPSSAVNIHAISSTAPFPPPAANKARAKRSRLPPGSRGEAAAEGGGGVRRCTHCASEKTPQWRTGPLGPKTLCNACGVRFKSGRLVPEYRPASSPTFVLTQHSNSHRKVLELRRQKEEVMIHQQLPPHQNFGLC